MKDEEEDKQEEQRRENMFWELLGGRAAIESAQSGGDDAESESAWLTYRKLFQVRLKKDYVPTVDPKEVKPLCKNCDYPLKEGKKFCMECGNQLNEETKKQMDAYFEYQANKPRFTKKKHPPFEAYELILVEEGRGVVKELLDPEGAFLLDCVNDVYPWSGKKVFCFVLIYLVFFVLNIFFFQVDGGIRMAVEKFLTQIVEEREKTMWMAPNERILAGSEPTVFKYKFPGWGSAPISIAAPIVGLNTAKTKDQHSIDVTKLYLPPKAKVDVMVDDGNGEIMVWRVHEFDKVEVTPDFHGQFYTADSYVIMYKYFFRGWREQYIIYYFQGFFLYNTKKSYFGISLFAINF